MQSTTQTGAWDRAVLWRYLAMLLLVLTAFIAFRPGTALAVAPPANSVIGNQATATYTDATATVRTATSNLVQTTVAQQYAFTLTASQSKTASAGGTVYFPHTITNNGNGSDSYSLATTDVTGTFTFTSISVYADANGDGIPDSTTTISASGAIAAGGQFKFVVAGLLPNTAAAGNADTITVGATSVGNAGNATNTDTTTVSNRAVINVVKAYSQQSGPSPSVTDITVTLTITNNGATASGQLGVTDILGATATIASTTYDTRDMAYVAASSTYNGNALTDPGVNAVLLNATTGVTMVQGASANVLGWQVPSLASGASATITFRVSVNASVAPGSERTTNAASYTYIDQAGGATIGPAATNTVRYLVNRVYSVVNDKLGGALTSSQNQGAVTDTVVRTNAPQGGVVWFDDIVRNTGGVEDTFNITGVNTTFPTGTTFTYYSSQEGAGSCQTLTDAGQGATFVNSCPAAPMVDSNGDGIPDTGPLSPSTAQRYWVRAQLPTGSITGTNMTMVVTATSVGDSSKSDPVTNQLGSILPRRVNLTNTTAIGGALCTGTAVGSDTVGGCGDGRWNDGSAGASPVTGETAVTTITSNPGATVTFSLVVNNLSAITDTTSAGADNYDLIADQDGTFGTANDLPTGWNVQFVSTGVGTGGATCPAQGTVVTNTGNIPAGGSCTFSANVTIPAGYASGVQNIYFRARSPVFGIITAGVVNSAADHKKDAVSVNSVASLTLVPNKQSQVFPGGNVVYSHQLCNSGNTLANATMSSSNNTTGWNSVVYLDDDDGVFNNVGVSDILATAAIAVTAGTCKTIFANVFAPLSATGGQTNNTLITAAGGAAGSPTVTDVSTVVSGDLNMTKGQANVNCTTGVNITPATAGTYQITTLGALAAGSCVKYQVVATNTGATPVTSVTIADAVPTYTTLTVAPTNCTPATTTTDTGAGVVGGTATAEGNTGTVVVTKATLNPLTSLTLTFCIKLNQ